MEGEGAGHSRCQLGAGGGLARRAETHLKFQDICSPGDETRGAGGWAPPPCAARVQGRDSPSTSPGSPG